MQLTLYQSMIESGTYIRSIQRTVLWQGRTNDASGRLQTSSRIRWYDFCLLGGVYAETAIHGTSYIIVRTRMFGDSLPHQRRRKR